MERTASSGPKPMTPSPEQLLRNFVNGPHSEAAFAQLVLNFERLIYSSAFRRTNNASLSEDITQAVLTILARKAKSLLTHPSLAGWIFQTTKLETMKALRTESRRQRKHRSFQEEPTLGADSQLNSSELSAWQKALPHLDKSLDRLSERDRDLILRRFFAKEKFKDIARATRSSEGACKKQLKRALERLESHLATGNTLSVTALGSALTISLASAPPAKAGTLLATQVISQASAVKGSTLLTNTLLTMNSTQKSIAIAALLVTATAVPAIQMASETSRLQKSLSSIHSQNQSLEGKKSTASLATRTPPSKRIAYDVLQKNSGPIDALSLLEAISHLETTENFTGILSLFIPIVELDEDELSLLLKDIKDCPSYPGEKETVIILIAELKLTRGDLDHRGQIEEFFDAESPSYNIVPHIRKWASENPNEALAWFQEKDQQGAFAGKGTESPRDDIYGNLIQGIFKSRPNFAKELYQKAEKSVRSLVALDFINQIEREIQSSGTTNSLESFLSIEPDNSIRQRATRRAAEAISLKTNNLDEGLRVLQMADGDHHNFPQALSLLAASQKNISLSQKVTWLENNLSQKELRANIVFLFTEQRESRAELNQWFTENPTSPFHDKARETVAFEMVHKGEFQAAREHAGFIHEENGRTSVLDYIDQFEKNHPVEASEIIIQEQ